MIESIKRWKAAHPDLWEFILFNILSNCATVTNFVVLWITTSTEPGSKVAPAGRVSTTVSPEL